MTYVGISPDGAEFRLSQPVRVRLNKDEDAPADAFTGVFPLEKSVGTVTGIRVYDKTEKLCFDGIVDDQKITCAGGRFLTLTGRSRAALLLDNEAIPQTYCMPSLSTIFERHVQPYGFTGFRGSKKMFAGVLAVTKGMSEWQAAEQFCRQYLNVTPRIADSVFDASGEVPQGEIAFGSGAVPYSSLVIQNQYAGNISELWAQAGANGVYYPILKEAAAIALGVRRRRCLSAGQNGESVLRAARKKSFAAEVVCPGEISVPLLLSARIAADSVELPTGLYVAETEYVLNSAGESTRFILRRRK